MNLRHATLHQLRIFSTVAQHGSFARAAAALHLSPPTLSLQVKQLAETVGEPLFEQLGKKIYLTDAGRTLAQACRDIENRMETLSQELEALRGVEKGQLRIAILTTLKYVVPRLLGRFCVEHPGVDATLVVGNREELLLRLARNQDDLYIMGAPPAHLDVVSEHFAEHELVIIAPPGHALVGKRRVSPRRLEHEPFILREPGSGTRLAAETFFAEHGFVPKNRLEIGSTEAIKQTVAGGLGLAVVSATAVAPELALGQLVRLDVQGFPLIRRWNVMYPKGKKLSPVATAFRAWLYKHRTPPAGR